MSMAVPVTMVMPVMVVSVGVTVLMRVVMSLPIRQCG